MALIDCPECEASVSSYANACPSCGFPVAESLKQVLNEVSGTDKARSSRHMAAAHKLEAWADRYGEEGGDLKQSGRKKKSGDRMTKVFVGLVAGLVVVLQLLWVYSALS